MVEAVQAARQPNWGRGGQASTSSRNPGATSSSNPLSVFLYDELAPRLVGRRSIAYKPQRALPMTGAEPLYDDRDPRWWTVKDGSLHGSYSWAMQDYQSEREEIPVPGDAFRAEMPSEEDLPPVLTCRDFVKQVLLDNKDAVHCAFADKPCPPGHYKVMAFVDAEGAAADPEVNYLDYNFYVQHRDVAVTLQPGDRLADVARFFRTPVEALYAANRDLHGQPPHEPLPHERSVLLQDVNVWSHKPSELQAPRLHDGAGRAIHDPRVAVPMYTDDEGEKEELPDQFCCAFCVRKGEARTGVPPL